MERTLPSVIHQGELVDVIRLTRILFDSNKNYGENSPHLVSEFLLSNEQKKRTLFRQGFSFQRKSDMY